MLIVNLFKFTLEELIFKADANPYSF